MREQLVAPPDAEHAARTDEPSRSLSRRLICEERGEANGPGLTGLAVDELRLHYRNASLAHSGHSREVRVSIVEPDSTVFDHVVRQKVVSGRAL